MVVRRWSWGVVGREKSSGGVSVVFHRVVVRWCWAGLSVGAPVMVGRRMWELQWWSIGGGPAYVGGRGRGRWCWIVVREREGGRERERVHCTEGDY
ncbi:hypothetical protein RHGRI_004772 [Rhododendron griersonianum]|uniref:Transmembrane protein n=1 Tax=Rhododendron griersonianum TaxID=479676 RepID=A0AAV6LAM8_9ERIC|nr:hypothetical protein RHGRI_004772 [Rhododendron griersonianum]